MSDKPSDGSSPPTPDAERTPFERFEDVLRRVVSVPKNEVDKKRRQG